MKKCDFYYFSGTGNSRNVAVWFSEIAKSMNFNCNITDIAKVDRTLIQPPDKDSLLLFSSPVHGFNYAPIMVHFLLRFPKGKNKVVLMNTRAGMKIGKYVTPGLSGITFYLASLILIIKGYRIQAHYPVDLPSNWISLHPALNDKTVVYIHQKIKERFSIFSKRVLNDEKYFKCLIEIIQDVIISPISLMYYIAGRFMIAKTFYSSSDCDDCGLCIKSCPIKAIKKIDNRYYWTFNCESCMKCMNFCPKKAINTGHGFISIYFIIMSLIAPVILLYIADSKIDAIVKTPVLSDIFEIFIYLLVLFILYLISHFLMRYRIFQLFMKYTSLTNLKFWGRYKAIKL